jgi:hypothetical protein
VPWPHKSLQKTTLAKSSGHDEQDESGRHPFPYSGQKEKARPTAVAPSPSMGVIAVDPKDADKHSILHL